MSTPASEAMPALEWRALDPGHLDAVYHLHGLAIGEVIRPEVVKPETRDFFAGILAGRGRMEGAFAVGKLVAYGVLQTDLPPYDDPRPFIGAPPDAPVAKLAGASVAPAFRGFGLQRALIAARVRIAPTGAILFATSAPANPPSWINLLSHGFAIRALVPYYGGHLRFLMVRDEPVAVTGEERLMEPLDIEGQMELLARRWRGVAVRPGPNGMRIAYARGRGDV